jgi:hypothetical protein
MAQRRKWSTENFSRVQRMPVAGKETKRKQIISIFHLLLRLTVRPLTGDGCFRLWFPTHAAVRLTFSRRGITITEPSPPNTTRVLGTAGSGKRDKTERMRKWMIAVVLAAESFSVFRQHSLLSSEDITHGYRTQRFHRCPRTSFLHNSAPYPHRHVVSWSKPCTVVF